ncbi:MAG TPA: YceI family protein [Lysobacter sp.]|nr:YceI family protein [Lysobacter sp.]
MRRELLAAALALASLAVPAHARDYVQARGSALTFASAFQGETFVGRFERFHTRLRFDPQQLAQARLEVDVALASAATANAERDDALKGADFFDASRFPHARYVATRFRALGGGRYAADGTLSLRGVDKPVTLTFTWTPGATPVLSGRASVRRLQFGVGGGDWADTGVIPDEVAVSARVLLQPAAGAPR